MFGHPGYFVGDRAQKQKPHQPKVELLIPSQNSARTLEEENKLRFAQLTCRFN